MTTSIWEVSWGSKRMLFSSRRLLMQSIKLSYHRLPNQKVTDHGNTILVEWDDDDGGVCQQWFAVNQIVNEHVYNDVEHL